MMMIHYHALHCLAYLALRFYPPLKAKQIIDTLGTKLPPLTFEQASHLEKSLRLGTCLSRSLTIASRLPHAQIVIGGELSKQSLFYAHAWVEWEGHIIGTKRDTLLEITRI